MSADDLFCEQCGSRLAATAVFCGSCGKPTGRAASPPAPPPVTSAPPPPPPVTLPPPQAAAAPPPVAPAPPAWAAGPGYAPAPSYGPPASQPPGPPPAGVEPPVAAGAARASVASQLPSIAQIATNSDYLAIIGGVIVAVAMILPVYASVSLISLPIWMLFTPILLAAGPIIVGFLRRSDQVGTQFAMATYLGFGALAATTYWGYLFYGLFGGGLFNGFGFGSLIGGIGAIIVIAAGVALLRTGSVR